MSDSKYKNPKIVRRLKGQRYDKPFQSLSDAFASGCSRGVPSNYVIEETGEGEGYQGYSCIKSPVYYFEATAPNGDVIPLYSFSSGIGPNGFMFAQNYSYKIAKAAKRPLLK